jgi:GT2 family glycosyltransferase
MVSVVIPNLHSPIIDQVIGAMHEQTVQDAIREILVVGQGQPNHMSSRVSYIPSQRPLSAARARNLGARLASGTYLLFLDADCIAAPDLVEHLLARHAQGYAVVGGSVVLERANYWLLSDNILTFAATLSTTAPGPRRYLPSLNMSIARDVFYAHDGFDEQFTGAAGEDVALSIRLRQRGYELFCEPRARVIHRPQRVSAGHLAAHLRTFGRVHVSLERRYGVRVSARLTTGMRFLSGLILALSPVLAAYDVVRLFRDDPALWRYAYTLPGMVWGKTCWYVGVVEALLAVPAQAAGVTHSARPGRGS